MLKNLYLAAMVAAAFCAAILLPHLLDGDDQIPFLSALLVNSSPKQIDRLEVGSPAEFER